MVLVMDLPNAFWGVTVNEGKRYTQKLTGAIHVSMAALEPGSNKSDDEPVSVMIQHDKADFMLCSLSSGKVLQQALDLNFNEGEEVTFYLKGKGVVHLTGYILTGDQYDSDSDVDFMPENSLAESDDSSSSDDDDNVSGGSKKRKKPIMDKKSKKAKVEIVGDDEDDEDEEEDGDSSADDSSDEENDRRYELIDGEAEEDFSYVDSDKDSCEESDMDDDDDDDEELTPKQKKSDKKKVEQSKKHQSSPSGQSKKDKKDKHNQRAAESTTASKEQSTSAEAGEKKKRKRKKNKNKKKESENSVQASAGSSDEKAPSSKPSSKVVEGVAIEDLKVGHGPEAKAGSTVHVYYTGRLINGKLFDSKHSGKPVKFRLGKKEIIKGWDIGLQGMKVGGKRKLVIPPHMGYGSQTVGTIPAHSTLQFEVELKAVN